LKNRRAPKEHLGKESSNGAPHKKESSKSASIAGENTRTAMAIRNVVSHGMMRDVGDATMDDHS
jgi:hypothetical protein